MDSAAISLANHGKVRCGDFWGFREFDNGRFSVGCVSDGVSGAAKDWFASQLTVETFFATFTSSDKLPVEDRLTAGVEAADKRVRQSLESGERRMLATFIAVVWDHEKNNLSWISCGDSRLYCIKSDKLVQLSVDDSKTIIARGRDGKLLVASGALITGNGLTVAIGALDTIPGVETRESEGIRAVLLATDGYYGCPSFNEAKVVEMCNAYSLAKTFKKHETIVHDEQHDDATVLVLRDPAISDAETTRMQEVIASDRDYRAVGLSLYIAIRVILNEVIRCLDGKNINRAIEFLDYTEKYEIDPGKTALVNLADKAVLLRPEGKPLFDRLILQIKKAGIRKCSNRRRCY